MENMNQLLAVRRQKLAKLREMGIDPYPGKSERTHKINQLRENQEAFVAESKVVTVAGRLIAMRRQGKVGFGNLADDTGKIQLFVKKDKVGEDNYEVFKLLDLGDFVQITGECFVTQKGEYSVRASNVKILSKTLRPLPVVKERIVDGKKERFDEFSDIELRYRKRYLDLLLNPEIKENFEIRAIMLREMRRYLDSEGFLEII